MSDSDTLPPEDELSPEETTEATAEETPAKLDLEADINEIGPCQRHIKVSVSRYDIDRFFDNQFSELVPDAQIPGFRPGRAPRKLVERRFRREVADRVKAEIVMAALEQVNEENKLSAISEPVFDFDAIDIPEEGPLVFEFDLEVRPDFAVPKWDGMKIKKPVREFSDADVDHYFQKILEGRGELIETDQPAAEGDYLTANLTFRHGDRVLSRGEGETIRIRKSLSFHDGQIDGFDEIMAGVKPGETRTAEAKLSEDAPNAALRGETVTAEFEITAVKQVKLPEITDDLVESLGFESEAEIRDAIRDQLTRQLEYRQHEAAREQVIELLTEAADWDLPPDLLERQSRRELQRAILEMRRAGFSEDEIMARENILRQNSRIETAKALKEHFILERIAEEEGIEPTDEDYDHEIDLIARQRGQSPRRVRAWLEKSESMDILRNQIIERRVIAKILDAAEYVEEPYEIESMNVEALDQAAGGHDSDIPDAKPEPEESED